MEGIWKVVQMVIGALILKSLHWHNNIMITIIGSVCANMDVGPLRWESKSSQTSLFFSHLNCSSHRTPALCVTGSTTLYPYMLSCLRNIHQLHSIPCFHSLKVESITNHLQFLSADLIPLTNLTYHSIPFGVGSRAMTACKSFPAQLSQH